MCRFRLCNKVPTHLRIRSTVFRRFNAMNGSFSFVCLWILSYFYLYRVFTEMICELRVFWVAGLGFWYFRLFIFCRYFFRRLISFHIHLFLLKLLGCSVATIFPLPVYRLGIYTVVKVFPVLYYLFCYHVHYCTGRYTMSLLLQPRISRSLKVSLQGFFFNVFVILKSSLYFHICFKLILNPGQFFSRIIIAIFL